MAAKTHSGLPLALAAVALAFPLLGAAQDDSQVLVEGRPAENAAVNRDIALRLRAEVQLSDDDDELVQQDPAYKLFPAHIYFGEAKLFQKDRLSFLANYAFWQNEQGLDVHRAGWELRLPFASSLPSYLTLRFRQYQLDKAQDLNYGYVGYGSMLPLGFYIYGDYRAGAEGGRRQSDQASGYVSWKPTNRFRVGSQAAGGRSQDEGQPAIHPWYVRLFATVFLREDITSLRMDAQHYDTGQDLAYEEYNAYLYQMVGTRSFVRLSYRYYDDNADLSSQAWGVKVQHYFSPRLSGHVGYRAYTHSEGLDLNTVYAGVSVLL